MVSLKRRAEDLKHFKNRRNDKNIAQFLVNNIKRELTVFPITTFNNGKHVAITGISVDIVKFPDAVANIFRYKNFHED